MALQPRIIACGTKRATIGMVIRFLCGPIIMSAASVAVGLRGVKLHAAIVQVPYMICTTEEYIYMHAYFLYECTYFFGQYTRKRESRRICMYMFFTGGKHFCWVFDNVITESQAALPQGIVPFVFAREYGLHPDILSTG